MTLKYFSTLYFTLLFSICIYEISAYPDPDSTENYDILATTENSTDSSNSGTTTSTIPVSIETTVTTPVPMETIKNKTAYLQSDLSIFDHVDWGNTTSQKYNGSKHPIDRYFFGYGECPKRIKINYQNHILDHGTTIQLILQAYAEMFRIYCLNDTLTNLMRFFDKGYAVLDDDRSISLEKHSVIFIKYELSYTETNDLLELIELAAFSQVYVSWYNFPVASIDPVGEPIRDACFIEILSRLHALDLVKKFANRYLENVAYSMAIELKPALREMKNELRKIHGNSELILKRKVIATNTLAVGMGLMVFLLKHSDAVLKGTFGCAHETFKKFYIPKRAKYVELARKLGKAKFEYK